ncbi:hypothetical protein [Mangrovicoccus ximenensis]|uniref:hypothetical protein n=1 Tax=Mangrovicoccus ximenensis TaxID=1911570 RepID=UPI001374EC5A|nr:hypothetical protein [Mangrovicoccus ximenensis]
MVVHGRISEAGRKALSPDWQPCQHSSHTLTSELAQIASEARHGVLAPPHVLHCGA